MTVTYRQGKHSPVNVWMDMSYGKDAKVQSTHIGMATSSKWARAVCEALNEQYARQEAGLGADLGCQERAVAGLEAFLHGLNMGASLADFPADLISRLRKVVTDA